MRDECCAARGSQQHMPEQLWHSDAATVPGSSRLKAAPKRKLLTHARVSIQHGSGHRSAQFASCAAQSSAARTARPGAPFAQKVSPLEKISCAGRRFHLSPRAADEIFQPLAKRPIPSKMRQWQKGQGCVHKWPPRACLLRPGPLSQPLGHEPVKRRSYRPVLLARPGGRALR